MKMTKEVIKQVIQGIQLIPSSSFKFSYLLLEDISTEDKCYNCYYGGGMDLSLYNSSDSKMFVRDLRNGSSEEQITPENIDEISERIYGYMNNSINKFIEPSLLEVFGDSSLENLKYFKGNKKKFTAFFNNVKQKLENELPIR